MGKYFMGIDIGSTASKCVIIDPDLQIIGSALHPSGAGTDGPDTVKNEALADCGITADDITACCSTGYGRNLIEYANEQISELSCHAKGAGHLFPTAHTVVDIGGQDAKVLRIGDNGMLENFVMNDKCAAGTGRFLDVMAGIFGCKVSDLQDLDAQATEVAPISSTCTVFAESEVISKLAAGTPIPNIVAGIHTSVVDRTYGLIMRLGVCPDVAMTGGVALNGGLRQRLSERIGKPILTSPLSQMNGAYGAAIFALEKYDKAE